MPKAVGYEAAWPPHPLYPPAPAPVPAASIPPFLTVLAWTLGYQWRNRSHISLKQRQYAVKKEAEIGMEQEQGEGAGLRLCQR